MNKQEFVDAFAEKSGMTKKDSAIAIETFQEIVSETISKGDKLQLIGFGTFEKRERKARTGRNPKSPTEIIEIPASNTAVFKAGKALKASVNK